MPAITKVFWNDRALRNAVRSAFRTSAYDFAKAAAARSPSRRVARSMRVQVLGDTARVGPTHPIAGLIEKGAKEHDIEPKNKQAMKLKGGGFARGKIPHPGMRARPFMRPTLPLFPGLYRRRARAML